MKRLTISLAALAVAASFVLQGCSSQTRNSMKQDVNRTARELDEKVS
ncbi:MAG TPA: hypothetical protein VL404_05280 [Candidatus Eisenbacteria bacterium]|nr:hypothetical protein [Candidatus Eisenbacteria bacterium]